MCALLQGWPCIRESTPGQWTSLMIGSTKRVRSNHFVVTKAACTQSVQELLVEEDAVGELHCGSSQLGCFDHQMAIFVQWFPSFLINHLCLSSFMFLYILKKEDVTRIKFGQVTEFLAQLQEIIAQKNGR